MEPLERKRKKTFWGVFKELTTLLLILVFIGPLCTSYMGVFYVVATTDSGWLSEDDAIHENYLFSFVLKPFAQTA